MTGVWIELPKPIDAVEAESVCVKANNMMARLAGGSVSTTFTWNDKRHRYEWGTPMGYETLEDWGKWFNLDYLGRPL
jgi:hypothetical protein